MRPSAFLALACALYAGAGSAAGKRKDGDYGGSDFWSEENPVEVERLMKEHRENRELIRNVATYYQIVYPVQVRHHERTGASTREPEARKVSKHFHRTSLIIKAFSYRFRLELELNTKLLAPNLVQKHFTGGSGQILKQDVEHCYYHGVVKDYPGAVAAFRTCNGVSGVIHVGNETFVIHPFFGGDLSARSAKKQECANTGNVEWGLRAGGVEKTGAHHKPRYAAGGRRRRLLREASSSASGRPRRDVRDMTKYIETALIVDRAMFRKRNTTKPMDLLHDALQIANIADLYFKSLNTRLAVVYVETWATSNQFSVEPDIHKALLNLNDYAARKLYKLEKDTTQLLTGEFFKEGESGMAIPGTMCTHKAVGLSVDLNVYEPHLTASTMAHMIGHNVGMGHDDGREDCRCQDWHGCLMLRSILGAEGVQPYKFSDCSVQEFHDVLRLGRGICLFNPPSQPSELDDCGNGIVDEGEVCDCGPSGKCSDPCCDPATCRLRSEAECLSSGKCCEDCRLRLHGAICREATSDCDLPEHCDGVRGSCPPDAHKRNGYRCNQNRSYCFEGTCMTRDQQCQQIWGYSGVAADKQCYEMYNQEGSRSGHCGKDGGNNYRKCSIENVMCGALQCQMGSRSVVGGKKDEAFSTITFSVGGREFECKVLINSEAGLVADGTTCNTDSICMNQTCTSIYPYINYGKCPSNNVALECSGHGICTSLDSCYCDPGWFKEDCSHQTNASLEGDWRVAPGGGFHVRNRTGPASGNWSKNTTTIFVTEPDFFRTLTLVLVLVSGVAGVFVFFALIAVCYRRKVVLPKCDASFPKKSLTKKARSSRMSLVPKSDASLEENDNVSGNREPPACREPKLRQMKRHDLSSSYPGQKTFESSRNDPILRGRARGPGTSAPASARAHSADTDRPPRPLFMAPSLPIGLVPGHMKDHCWPQVPADLEEDLRPPNVGSGGPLDAFDSEDSVDAQRTVKSINSYHDDIIQALRNPTPSRGPASIPAYEDDPRKLHHAYADYAPQNYLKKRDAPRGSSNCSEEEEQQPGHPLRIRNLEDLIRQLERDPGRRASPCDSEDMRIASGESSGRYPYPPLGDPGSSRLPPMDEFAYGRYRQPSCPSSRGKFPGAETPLSGGGRAPSPEGSRSSLIPLFTPVSVGINGIDDIVYRDRENSREMLDLDSEFSAAAASKSSLPSLAGLGRPYSYERAFSSPSSSQSAARSDRNSSGSCVPSLSQSDDAYAGRGSGAFRCFSTSGESRSSRDLGRVVAAPEANFSE